MTTETFISKALQVHSGKYSYTAVDNPSWNEKIDIICPTHGTFKQKTYLHLSGRGCRDCGKLKTKALTTEIFISKAINKHGNKYNYSKISYIRTKTPVIITCPKHGDFVQKPNDHLNGSGCPCCYKENSGFGRSSFVSYCKDVGLLYIIFCFNEEERFVKIGITSKSVEERFYRKRDLPYKYEIVALYRGSPESIYNLEKVLHRKFKTCKYNPKKPFKGSTECFTLKILYNDF